MSNLFRDNLYNEFPDPNKKIEVLNDKVSRIKNIAYDLKDYENLVSNGDWTNALVAIVNDVHAAGGGRIQIPNGEYSINTSGRLLFSKKKNIAFIGSGLSVLKSPINYNNVMFQFDDCENILFEGIVFDGNRQTALDEAQYGHHGLVLSKNTKEVTFSRCKFLNINDTAIIDKTQSDASVEYPLTTDTKVSQLIISNCRFKNIKSCFNTKGGGSTAGLIVDNHISKCVSGFKLDGETYGTDVYPSFMSSWIISGNVFYDIGSATAADKGVGAINIEEHISDIIVSNNIIKKSTGADGVILSTGQTNKDTKNIHIENNVFSDMSNGYGIVARQESAGADMFNLTITNNKFRRMQRSGVYLKNMYSFKEVKINQNQFIDWGVGVNEPGVTRDALAIYLDNSAIMQNLQVEGNRFAKYDNTLDNTVRAFSINANTLTVSSVNSMVMKGNTFTGVDINTLLGLIRNVYISFDRNTVVNGKINIENSTLRLKGNEFEQVNLLTTVACKLTVSLNEFKKGTENFAVRVDGSTVVDDYANNTYEGFTYTNAFYMVSGTRNFKPKQGMVLDSGTTATRPTVVSVGSIFFDTTLGKPIYVKSLSPTVWVDATGTAV